MASDKSPSDPYLPFGYAIDPNQEPLDPPEPPPGDPLLTDSDSKFLSSFFEDMTADPYNMPSFGEGLNFSDSWLDLPPQLMGTATSFGPQFGSSLASTTGPAMAGGAVDYSRSAPEAQLMPPPPLPHNHHHIPSHPAAHQPLSPRTLLQQHNTQYHMQQQQQQQHPPQHASQHQYHSDDVLNAAATLLQNGSGSRAALGNHDYNFPRQPGAHTTGHLMHQPVSDGHGPTTQPPQKTEYGSDWMYGAQQERIPPAAQNDRANDFQWGSDANFSPAQGYTPRQSRGVTMLDSMHREQMSLLEALEVSKSAASTRPSSPSNQHGQKPQNTAQILPKVNEDPEAPPRKRRKSKTALDRTESADGGDTGDQTLAMTATSATSGSTTKSKRRKPKAERPTEDNSPPTLTTLESGPGKGERSSSEAGPSAGGAGKRRKSSMNGSKAARENLSEEQKRENHIRSEQKRRTLIKEGFDDLCELVPGLRGGGFSKSTMLSIAAEYLEELLQGNEALANQLATTERG